uniref:Uncharacterized protein n=1 Tax=Palpitomonas bilix TaxID=652834 RepID=A0A7S3CYT8_9EUKA|mmetsp:Transcript_15083/g.38118  ORF Transcript_15083/g.38118 Transcript_15083/m.38118 type:complete len:135 (+) Transcript_15083:415-819(+)|eukprot:CAMPEP_0113880908 /NCGR_PEP_ID=MMETSP0780_2-20120614/8064_1 /TAXON_ID=652834 /ORGANISM="Palpitomonas bilix" /LENGTH=134 /DNA_ID=CAMNT_0000867671 /DNA_START=181 /DNA_END=585 /DNA_ORIENTATION=- /assembly_acc=CAM_ASM_000599
MSVVSHEFEGQRVETEYENTYQLRPHDNQRFNAGVVREIIRKTLAEKLEGKDYDAAQAPNVTKELCTAVKEKVKATGCTRHKLVVQATIGQMKGQGVRIASRCLWDVETDNYASDSFQNESLYCVCMVFGCYYE